MDPDYSVTLIELITEADRHILVLDYINGGSLNNLIACRDEQLKELEV